MRKGHSIECSPDDLMKYVAILLLSGYIPVKHRRMLETRADAHNSLVSSAMTRNIFEEIHRFSHLNDNSKKWYWPHIRFCINSAVVNAWISYRHVDKNMPLLQFTRRVVLAVLTGPQCFSPRRVRPSRISKVRYANLFAIMYKI